MADHTGQPLGEQVLHEHLIHRFAADVRVERVPAEREEAVERGLELLDALVGRGQDIDLPSPCLL
jgi:hypothetical protein